MTMRARLGAEHAKRAEAVAFACGERRSGIVANALRGEERIAVAGAFEQVRHQHEIGSLGHLGARRLLARDRPVIDADPRLEPLAVAIGERHRRDRQAEDLRGHARDAVEALAGRGVEQVQPMQRFEPGFFIMAAHSLPPRPA
jgi:hypothetical protein